MSRILSVHSIVSALAFAALQVQAFAACSDNVIEAAKFDFQTEHLPRELSGFFPYTMANDAPAVKYATEVWVGGGAMIAPSCGCWVKYQSVIWSGQWTFSTSAFSDTSTKSIGYSAVGCVGENNTIGGIKGGLGSSTLAPRPTETNSTTRKAVFDGKEPTDYTCGPFQLWYATDVTESLIVPFTMEDAIKRAENLKTVSQHTDGIQLWHKNSPSTGYEASQLSATDPILCHAQRVSFRAEFTRICAPGSYLITCYYKRWPIGSPEPTAFTDVKTDQVRFEDAPFVYPAADAEMVKYPFELVQGMQCKLVRVTATSLCTDSTAGSHTSANGSVEETFPLGKRANGLGAGVLQIRSATILPVLYTPLGLGVNVTADVKVIGSVRQVLAPQALVDVVPLSATAYELQFYPAPQNPAVDSRTGLYPIVGSPFVTYRIDNPDADTTGEMTRLRIVETRDGMAKTTLYSYHDGIMSLVQGDGLRQEDVQTAGTGANVTITRTIKGPSGAATSVVRESRQDFPFGSQVVQRVVDPNGAALTTTYAYYDFLSSGIGNYGRIRRVVEPSGRWTEFKYDDQGRTIETITQFLDQPIGSDPAQNRDQVTLYGTIPDGGGDAAPEKLETTVDYLLGQEIRRSFKITFSDRPSVDGSSVKTTKSITATVRGAQWDAPTNLVTTRRTIVGGKFDLKPLSELRPDGTLTLYRYEQGTSTLATTRWEGAADSSGSAVVAGTKTVTVTDLYGALKSETVSDIGSQLVLSSKIVTTADPFGRPTRIDYGDGTYETKSYACCGLESETDRQGVTTSFAYDSIGRVVATTRDGISTVNTLAVDGSVLATTRQGTDGSLIRQQTLSYDVAGRLTSQQDALNRTTTFAETRYGPQTVKTTTNPDGGTRVEVYSSDGSLVQVGGTAARASSYAYGADSDGEYTQEFRGGTTEWVKTYTDVAGRVYKTVYPDGAVSTVGYNNFGQKIKATDPDGVTMLYAYDARGQVMTSAIDINGNGLIDYNDTDRIMSAATEVATRGSDVVVRTTTKLWLSDGQDLATIVSIDEQGADGRKAWHTAHGLTSSTVTTYTGTGGRTVTSVTPDAVQSVQTYLGDRLASSSVTAGGIQLSSMTYTYDAHGRLSATVDARTGATTYTYFDDDQPRTVTTPDPDPAQSGNGYDPQTTTYAYDIAGRQNSVAYPDSAVVSTTYYPTGLVKRVSGARTYPVEYAYDAAGRMKRLTTWRDYTGNSGQAVTSWNYDPQRGWLINKVYADGKGPTYSYTPAGRLKTRTWARGVITTYTYNAAGDLAATVYSNGDPTAQLTYDRAGRLASKTDDTGVCTYVYLGATNSIVTESHTSGLLSGVALTRGFDDVQRLSSIGVTSASMSVPTASYAYDAGSRLATVTSGQNTATYGYLPNTSLVQTLTFQNAGATRLATTKMYDNLNRLTSVSNASASFSSLPSVQYQYNAANQRTRATREDNAYWSYTYDALGQVTNGSKYLADGSPATGLAYGYSYDDIGNRKTSSANGQTSAYTANSLNQYLQRTVPPNVDVLGSAASDAVVTVNGQSTQRQGESFYTSVSYANAARPIWAELAITAKKNNSAATETRHAWLPANEVCSYDADGNLLADRQWSYTWNAENRLVAIETRSDILPPIGPFPLTERKRLEFAYDAIGRRIGKRVFSWSGAAWHPLYEHRFVYDGWNLIAELSLDPGPSSLVLVRNYTWGLDLSGTMQGAGGVGGLLSVTDAQTGATHFTCYDGNGNVTGLVSATDGSLAARYDYNAFGEIVVEEGNAIAAQNPFRFSTKYTDDETALVYYGYRYYGAGVGRWLSKDPIEESGGRQLYGFCQNSAMDLVDRNGNDFGFFSGAGSGYTNYLGKVPIPGTGDKALAYQIVKYFGEVNDPLADKFLQHWIWGHGEEYHLSDAEFSHHAWGYEPYRINKLFDNIQIKGRRDSLMMDPNFDKDLQSKCKNGKSFSGTYYIPDYALTPRTLGHILWIVEVMVDCKCNEIGKFGYQAKGTIKIRDAWDFNAMSRIRGDEDAVASMRALHDNTGIGADFPITSRPYPVSENWSGFAYDTPFLRLN